VLSRGQFGFASLVINQSLWTFVHTTLADMLQDKFGYSSELVSLIYTIQIAGFLVTSLTVHKVLAHFNSTK
jgi:hypothetical protein